MATFVSRNHVASAAGSRATRVSRNSRFTATVLHSFSLPSGNPANRTMLPSPNSSRFKVNHTFRALRSVASPAISAFVRFRACTVPGVSPLTALTFCINRACWGCVLYISSRVRPAARRSTTSLRPPLLSSLAVTCVPPPRRLNRNCACKSMRRLDSMLFRSSKNASSARARFDNPKVRRFHWVGVKV